MDKLELNTVPIINNSITLDLLKLSDKNLLESLLYHADGFSIFGRNLIKREGLVFRSVNEFTGIKGTFNGRLSFKVISNQYLLKKED
jgi:hypothetical protein